MNEIVGGLNMQSSFLKLTVGPIFALTFYALPLVSDICASTASAETPSTEQEQAEKDMFKLKPQGQRLTLAA